MSNCIDNSQSVRLPLMPPPSAFAYPYGESNDFSFKDTFIGNHMSENTKVKTKKQRAEEKMRKEMLIERREKINKILLTVKKQWKKAALLEERKDIQMQLEEIGEAEEINKNIDKRSTGPGKLKNRESLLVQRRCLKELFATSLLTKKKKEEVERELTEIDAVLYASDYEFAEQLFGNVCEPNFWKDGQNPYPPQGYCKTEGPYSDINCNPHREQGVIPTYNVPPFRQENYQAPLASQKLCQEISSTSPYTERLHEQFHTDGFHHSNYRERTGNVYRKESPEYPSRQISPGYSKRVRSPDDSHREKLSDFSNRHRSTSPLHRERPSCFPNRDMSPSSSYRERTPIPPTDFVNMEEISDLSYRQRLPVSYNERSPRSSSRERSPYQSYRNKSCTLRNSSQEPEQHEWQLEELHQTQSEDSYSHQHIEEGEDKDLRVQLLFLREQKAKMELKRLEEASIETERKLKELHEKRLTEEVDDFLRKQSKLWRREDMKGYSNY